MFTDHYTVEIDRNGKPSTLMTLDFSSGERVTIERAADGSWPLSAGEYVWETHDTPPGMNGPDVHEISLKSSAFTIAAGQLNAIAIPLEVKLKQ